MSFVDVRTVASFPGYLRLNAQADDVSGRWISTEKGNSLEVLLNITDLTETFDVVAESHDREAPGALDALYLTGGSDRFMAGDTLTGGTSGATADVTRVADDVEPSGTLLVLESVTGRFEGGEAVTSGATAGTVRKFLPAAQTYEQDRRNIGTTGAHVLTFALSGSPSTRLRLDLDSGASVSGDVGLLVRRI